MKAKHGLPLGIVFLLLLEPVSARAFPPPGNDGPSQRAYEVAVMVKIIDPVLTRASEGVLKEKLPRMGNSRDSFAPLEALGRTIAGAAPWLELGATPDPEGQLRGKYIELAVKSISRSVDPNAPSFLNFNRGGGQPLVDAAFLAQGLLRAPTALWGNLDEVARRHVVEALKSSRVIAPPPTNWELFSAMVEAALLEFTGECDLPRIEKAVRDHEIWYKGDGTYGDGPEFHWDYYNSYVIQPMLTEILTVCAQQKLPLAERLGVAVRRSMRYAEVQERTISPEGTFPILGRSSAYRFAAFQLLSLTALKQRLPKQLQAGGVRAALNEVIHRMIEAPGTFDENGWLMIGAVGSQPALGEEYINRGSIYLCTEGLLQLGLPATDAYWSEPTQPWTQKRLWSGENLPADHALKTE